MEIGRVYVIDNDHRGKTFYRLIEKKMEMESFMMYTFWYKNKFGEGLTYKHEKDIKNMILANDVYQVLYGAKV